jgi:iron(III) transport system permease protein
MHGLIPDEARRFDVSLARRSDVLIMRLHKLPQALLLLILLAVFAVFLIYPIWLTVRGGFEARGGGFTLYHVTVIFTDPALRAGLINTFGIAVCTTLLCLILALPLAVLNAKYDYPFKTAFGALILIPLILPPFVGAIGLHHILGRA